MSVSVCLHIPKTTCTNLTKFSVHVTCGHGSALFWRQCNLLCTLVLWIMSHVNIMGHMQITCHNSNGVCLWWWTVRSDVMGEKSVVFWFFDALFLCALISFYPVHCSSMNACQSAVHWCSVKCLIHLLVLCRSMKYFCFALLLRSHGEWICAKSGSGVFVTDIIYHHILSHLVNGFWYCTNQICCCLLLWVSPLTVVCFCTVCDSAEGNDIIGGEVSETWTFRFMILFNCRAKNQMMMMHLLWWQVWSDWMHFGRKWNLFWINKCTHNYVPSWGCNDTLTETVMVTDYQEHSQIFCLSEILISEHLY